MVLPAENIAQAFFQTSVANIKDEDLKQLVADDPYYGAAQSLLASKMFTEKQSGYEQALQKAALHFSNELLLYYNLNNSSEFAVEDRTSDQANEEEIIVDDEFATDDDEEFPEDEMPVSDLTEDAILNDKLSSLLKEQAAAMEEPDETDANIPVSDLTEDAILNDKLSNLLKEQAAAMEEPDEADANIPVSDLTEDAILNNKLSSLLKEQAAAMEEPIDANTEIPVVTTPYHRVDYFESQGIKLEQNTTDKLGVQLKRFTDWLKQMKSINPYPTELRNDVEGEHKVENIAEHSNEAEEIVTETMAEVLIKQGKPDQAINIYKKLSFIYPSKTAYFAAKIEELKVK